MRVTEMWQVVTSAYMHVYLYVSIDPQCVWAKCLRA